jgi:hypothetical protein
MLEADDPAAAPEPVISSLIISAYERELEQEWREGEKAPHGAPWFTSMHASQFPGDDEACGRYAVYSLLDPPKPAPFKPFLKAWFDLGLNLEHDWVRRLRSYGALLSADVTAEDSYQTGFVDEEHWLTGSTDAVVLPRGWHKAHLAEVKTTSHEKVLQLRSATPMYPLAHAKYVRQLKAYIGLAHEMPFTPTVTICDESGALISERDGHVCPMHGKGCSRHTEKLQPPDDGTLIYSSREEPLTTASFRVFYDPEFMRAGRKRLAEWRDYYLRGEIPPHPYESKPKKWTGPLCERCDLKSRVCKPDYQDKVERLQESNLIAFAKEIRPEWEYIEKRAQTLFRWNAQDLSQRAEETVNVGNGTG